MAARVERALGGLQRGEARLVEAFYRSHLGLAARDAVERGFGLLDLRLRIDALAGVERVLVIGRASCRVRVCTYVKDSVVAVALKNNIQENNNEKEKNIK